MNNKSKMEISLVTQFIAKPGKEDELATALRRLIEPVRREDGCLRLNIYQDKDNERILIAVETFANPDALDLHRTMPYVLDFIGNIAPKLVESQSVTYYDEVLPE